MSDSEKSVDASKKRFSNVVWAILVILGLAWWFYPQIRILVKTESLSAVSQETTEETQLPAAVGEAPEDVDSVDAEIADAPETVEAQETTEETQLPAVLDEAPADVDSVDAEIADAPETVEAQETAEETQLPAVLDEAPEDVDSVDAEIADAPETVEAPADVDSVDAKIADAPETVEAQEVPVASPLTEGAPTVQPLEQNQDEISTETDMPLAALKPQINSLAAPEFDLVRIDEDGSAVIAGLADGMGFVVLSVDGVELSEARANLNGSGQFVIFALLPSTQAPQALRLHLYTEDGNSVIISTETVFVAAAPKVEEQDVVVAAGADEAVEPSDKTVITATAQIEAVEVANQPTVILADELGVRVLQDASQNEFVGTVSIDTISYNLLGEVSIGGRAAGRGFVRVYLNNKLITTSEISDSGYWKVDLLDVGAGIYTLRVDELNSAGEVLSRAETPFKREEQEDLVALMDVTDDTSAEETPTTIEVETQQQTEIIQITVEVQAEVEALVASVSGTGLEAEVSGATSKATVAQPSKAETALATPSLTFRVKTVQPGSTLWAIAKESYGAGIEYFKVFEANKERIRDPDLIYPGQVFEIPD
jgi:LysM repeat protein